MDYKYFKLNCILRVIILTLSIFAFVYLLYQSRLYATTSIVGIAIVLQVYGIIRYIQKTNRDLARFLSTIKYSDFSQSFNTTSKESSFNSLHSAFAEVISEFQSARAEKEEQYQYFRTVVQHIGLGLISYDNTGQVDLINNAAKRLLKVNALHNVNALSSLSTKLVTTLLKLKAGGKALVAIDDEGESLRLSIYATELKIKNNIYTLVSIHNIESELAEQEMESWQKLIRVLTHEIMNSVTPIASLASTANTMIEEWGASPELESVNIDIENVADIHLALSTIERRSQGLLHFIEAYRNLTRIPVPRFQLFRIDELLKRTVQLLEPQIKHNKIDLSISIQPDNLELLADKELIEQVLINILLNAIQAVTGVEHPFIKLNACYDEKSKTVISVSDNGPGIEDSVKEKIFTPFFTTKKDGSGIGLSLSRQIMRLHKGTISLHSQPDKKTVFRLRF